MQSTAKGLAVLLLLAAATRPSLAQDAAPAGVVQHPAACTEDVAEYFGCLPYGTLTPEQARTARGHPEFVARQIARTQAPAPAVVAKSSAAAPEPTKTKTNHR